MKRSILITCAAFVGLAACNGGGGEAEQNAAAAGDEANVSAGAPAAAGATASAMATLQDPSGANKGTAAVAQAGGDLRVQVQATGLPQGPHGIHVHMTGTCTPPDFSSAGSHWNPTDKDHGTGNPTGHHLGDMPNIEIDASGNGTLEYTITGGTLEQLFDADGAAVVIHAKADDYRTDPSGNSGDRIACGVLQRGGTGTQA